MGPFIAVIKAGARHGMKCPKSPAVPAIADGTCFHNVRSYMLHFPQRWSHFVAYGPRIPPTLVTPPYCTGPITPTQHCAPCAVAGGNMQSRTLYGSSQDMSSASGASQPPKERKFTVRDLGKKYGAGQNITMVTAYDYATACLANSAGIDIVLVGDSLGMVVMGRDGTTSVSMAEMLHHCKAAVKGAGNCLVVGDLPFGSYLDTPDATRNAVSLLKEGGVHAVKLEGGARVLPQVKAIVDAGVAVVGHVGLTPQTHSQLGGYHVQGKTLQDALTLCQDALALQEAGCCALVLECVPAEVAEHITNSLSIPTIGIGAGAACSGQVQVMHDLLGLYDKFTPKFAKRYLPTAKLATEALEQWRLEVEGGLFPSARHSFHLPLGQRQLLQQHATLTTTRNNPSQKPMSGIRTNTGASHTPALANLRCTLGQRHRARNGHTVKTPNWGRPAPAAPEASSQGVHSAAGAEGAPRVFRCLEDWRSFRSSLEGEVGLVPTMGALHEGHLSLVRHASQQCDHVVVTVFVNPKQFAPGEDLDAYPRTWDQDLHALQQLGGVTAVLCPLPDAMYPPGHRTCVLLEGVDRGTAEGSSRPGFFSGVATVCTKLFNLVAPGKVFFGQKDGLQCIVIRRLVADMNFPIQVSVCPTVREEDGLAKSSRNAYLNHEQRSAAPAVYRALCAAEDLFEQGERQVSMLKAAVVEVIAAQPLMKLDYVSVASGLDGQEMATLQLHDSCMLSIAVQLDGCRLIDNVLLEPPLP